MSYVELKKQIEDAGFNLPCSAVNSDGEFILIEEGNTETKEHYYRLTTVQDNNRIRVNIYYEDGSSEQLFE